MPVAVRHAVLRSPGRVIVDPPLAQAGEFSALVDPAEQPFAHLPGLLTWSRRSARAAAARARRTGHAVPHSPAHPGRRFWRGSTSRCRARRNQAKPPGSESCAARPLAAARLRTSAPSRDFPAPGHPSGGPGMRRSGHGNGEPPGPGMDRAALAPGPRARQLAVHVAHHSPAPLGGNRFPPQIYPSPPAEDTEPGDRRQGLWPGPAYCCTATTRRGSYAAAWGRPS